MVRRNDPILGDSAVLSLALRRREKKGKTKRLKLDEAVISHLNLGVKALESVTNEISRSGGEENDETLSDRLIREALELLRGSSLSQREIVHGTGRVTTPSDEMRGRMRYDDAKYVFKFGERRRWEEEQRQLREEPYGPQSVQGFLDEQAEAAVQMGRDFSNVPLSLQEEIRNDMEDLMADEY